MSFLDWVPKPVRPVSMTREAAVPPTDEEIRKARKSVDESMRRLFPYHSYRGYRVERDERLYQIIFVYDLELPLRVAIADWFVRGLRRVLGRPQPEGQMKYSLADSIQDRGYSPRS